jgi:hypothetical protein
MPYVHAGADGSVDALFLHQQTDTSYLPLSDIRVLRFLQASDPALTTAMLNNSDETLHVLLSSLIDLLVRKHLLPDAERPQQGALLAHMQLDALLHTVETDNSEALLSLAQSDRNTVRLIEDVIDVLTLKGVLSPAELPPGARNLLAMRRALRVYLADHDEDLEEETGTAH